MSGPFGSSQWGYASGEAAVEGQSLRFNDDDSAYLEWTPSVARSANVWTFSVWFKRGNLSSSAWFPIWEADAAASTSDSIGIYQDKLSLSLQSATRTVTIPDYFRDPSAWYHLVISWDENETGLTDTLKIWVNGVRKTDYSYYLTALVLDSDTFNFGTNVQNRIGARTSGTIQYFDGYLSEVNFIDGTAYDADDFGETDANGQWVPIKEPSVTYGTNGFYLPFTNDYEVEGFNTVTYRGNGGTQYVGGVGFEPDLVWIKERTSTSVATLNDSVRGVTKYIVPSTTAAEGTMSDTLTSFDPDGFTVGSNGAYNQSGEGYVAWCWDAGTGSPASNTDGSITSTVKANPDYGFSIVSYTNASSGSQTVGHGLGTAPDVIIVKLRSTTSNWFVYHSELGETKNLYLDTSSGVNTQTTIWNDTAPTSSVFTLGTAWNGSATAIAYCFHSVAGYSDFGSYTGTGSAGSPTVTTGFKPAFVIIKRTDASGYGWLMFDSTRNPDDDFDALYADTSGAEFAYNMVDFTDTGFVIQGTSANTAINASGGTYIYMAFADKREAAFWLDQSGNNNDWTNNNMQESDISLDSPTNNWCVLNSLTNTGGTFTEGNLQYVGPSLSRKILGTTGVSTGKWYWEVAILNAPFSPRASNSQYNTFGFSLASSVGVTTLTGDSEALALGDSGYYRNFTGSWTDGGTAIASGDVLACAVDLDAGTFAFKKNNVDIITGSIDSSADGKVLTPHQASYDASYGKMFCNFGQDSSFAGNKTAQGNTDENGFGDFYYEPPAGYLALCTQNLPDPAINDGTEHFNTVLYTGDGTSNRTISGVGFQPDLTWIKGRSTAVNHRIADSLRQYSSGAYYLLSSNLTAAEVATFDFSAFTSDGFTISDAAYDINDNTTTYAAWNWKAGGTGVANTDGTISSTVSANTTAGFSIVGYSGNGTLGATVGHGLSQAPDMIIVKDRSRASTLWPVYHSANTSAPETDYLRLDATSATADSVAYWADTAPTSSVFSIGNSGSINTNGDDYIAYCFHSVEGYSKFGKYTGNGSADGPFVYTGFRPAWLLVKRTNSTGNWFLVDATRNDYNLVNSRLQANSSATEANDANNNFDFLSNGFKLRAGTGTDTALSGSTYIYMAFAESPFKYSSAR